METLISIYNSTYDIIFALALLTIVCVTLHVFSSFHSTVQVRIVNEESDKEYIVRAPLDIASDPFTLQRWVRDNASIEAGRYYNVYFMDKRFASTSEL